MLPEVLQLGQSLLLGNRGSSFARPSETKARFLLPCPHPEGTSLLARALSHLVAGVLNGEDKIHHLVPICCVGGKGKTKLLWSQRT